MYKLTGQFLNLNRSLGRLALLFYHLEEVVGNWGSESDSFAGDGMNDGECGGVESDAVDGAGMAAILAVAAHGIAQVVHVHPYLVLAPGLNL